MSLKNVNVLFHDSRCQNSETGFTELKIQAELFPFGGSERKICFLVFFGFQRPPISLGLQQGGKYLQMCPNLITDEINQFLEDQNTKTYTRSKYSKYALIH